MTDQHFKLFNLPDEIIQYTGQFLTIPQLATFKRVCTKFNLIGAQAQFAQIESNYKRLYELDDTLAPLTWANAALQYSLAFKKIHAKQSAECTFLLQVPKKNPTFGRYPDGVLKILSSMQEEKKIYISTLEKRERFLNEINGHIIKRAVARQPGEILNLSSLITRLVILDENIDYFKNLKSLVCQNNLLITLNLNNHPQLEVLDCTNNTFLKKIYLNGCSKSLDLKCDEEYPPKIYLDDVNMQDKKDFFLYIEEIRLFEKLRKVISDMSKETKIIQKLGERYNVENCLIHGCFEHAGKITKDYLLEKTSNFFISFGRPSKKEDSPIPQQELLKRKRNDSEDDEPNNNKKHKPGGDL